MQLNSWTLVEQDGEHVLHNFNQDTTCTTMIPIDVCQDNANRNLGRMVVDRRIHQGERNSYVGNIDNESLDFSQLEDFINNEADSNASYFNDTLSRQDGGDAQHMTSNIDHTPGRSLHQHHHLSQTTSHSNILDKGHVVSAISPNTYASSISGITGLDNSYGYAHSHLPESPPDSGSEPHYSPQEGVVHSPMRKTTNSNMQDMLLQNNSSGLTEMVTLPYVKSPLQHTIQMQNSCADTILLQHSTILTPLLTHQQQQQQQAMMSPLSPNLNSNRENLMSLDSTISQNNESSPYLAPPQPRAKKRKLSQEANNIRVKHESDLSLAPNPSVAATVVTGPLSSQSTVKNEDEYGYQDSNGSMSDSSAYMDASCPCIRFQPFQPNTWHALCDQNFEELPTPVYSVGADKGFNFSNADDAFVCQKKNHFQITCQARLEGDARFVKTDKGFRKICSFHLHFYGVKMESPSQTIKVEQSQSDRSKKAFHPVLIDLRSDQITKITVGRLHFSETTSNNMRKKGKPNPDQRYFYLVVGLHAHCNDDNDYQIISHCSEKIIVRASNPGQFENDVELCWQRGTSPESIFHAGRVGINTDRPDESLVVHGNVKVSGHIMKPSDRRIKTKIELCNSRQQLKNIRRLNVVRFQYTPQYSAQAGLYNIQDTGFIAQDVQKVLPEAITSAGNLLLPDGTKFENFLLVDKERIYMENIGAVKELCKITDILKTRIDNLERMNTTRKSTAHSTAKKSKLEYGSKNGLCFGRIRAIFCLLAFVVTACLASTFQHTCWEDVTANTVYDVYRKIYPINQHVEFSYRDRNKSSRKPSFHFFPYDTIFSSSANLTRLSNEGDFGYEFRLNESTNFRISSNFLQHDFETIFDDDTSSSVYILIADNIGSRISIGYSYYLLPLGADELSITAWETRNCCASMSPKKIEILTVYNTGVQQLTFLHQIPLKEPSYTKYNIELKEFSSTYNYSTRRENSPSEFVTQYHSKSTKFAFILNVRNR